MTSELRLKNGCDMYLQIYEHYRNKILFGSYLYGDKLPTYTALCELYQVSITTIKKAYQKLAAEGLINLSNKGSYVSFKRCNAAKVLAQTIIDALNAAQQAGAKKDDLQKALEIVLDKYC